jgi:hypothetical protein
MLNWRCFRKAHMVHGFEDPFRQRRCQGTERSVYLRLGCHVRIRLLGCLLHCPESRDIRKKSVELLSGSAPPPPRHVAPHGSTSSHNRAAHHSHLAARLESLFIRHILGKCAYLRNLLLSHAIYLLLHFLTQSYRQDRSAATLTIGAFARPDHSPATKFPSLCSKIT